MWRRLGQIILKRTTILLSAPYQRYWCTGHPSRMMSQQTAAWAGRASVGRTPWSHFCLRQTWTAPSDPPTWKLSPGLGSHQGDFLWKLSRSALRSRNVIGTRRQKRRFCFDFWKTLNKDDSMALEVLPDPKHWNRIQRQGQILPRPRG